MTLSVTELVARLKRAVEAEATDVKVSGEIGSCKTAASGHVYFTLKDATAQLQCVFYRYQALSSRVRLREGLQVELTGRATVWEGRGSLQFTVSSVKEAGQGSLQQQFEELKRKLAAEGLFDPARKKKLPPFPMSVGLITSATGAVIQDMRHRLASRAPWMKAYLLPVAVQGKGAEIQIAHAIEQWNAPHTTLPPVDYLIIARGGGSLEDLWCFNEELLARAIAGSRLPIVSAVGHETDFTIADFVADLRAPTPTAAIELTTPDGTALRAWFAQTEARMQRSLQRALQTAHLRLRAAMQGKLRNPLEALAPFAQKLDVLEEELKRAADAKLEKAAHRLSLSAARIGTQALSTKLHMAQLRLDGLEQRICRTMKERITTASATLETLHAKLTAASPQNALDRGFALVRTPQGKLARNAGDFTTGDPLNIVLARGELDAEVTAIREPQA